jgi:hypothetical protein
MFLRTMSFDAIENQHRLEHKSGETIQEMIPVVSGWCALGKQAGAAGSVISDIGRDNFNLGRNMSYDTWNHSRGREPSSETRVLCEIVHEHRYPLDLIAVLAPSRLKDEPQLVMDRLLRECLKRKPPTQ